MNKHEEMWLIQLKLQTSSWIPWSYIPNDGKSRIQDLLFYSPTKRSTSSDGKSWNLLRYPQQHAIFR
jgi:hypothetical protein